MAFILIGPGGSRSQSTHRSQRIHRLFDSRGALWSVSGIAVEKL
jgi:hypothetical protein